MRVNQRYVIKSLVVKTENNIQRVRSQLGLLCRYVTDLFVVCYVSREVTAIKGCGFIVVGKLTQISMLNTLLKNNFSDY